jgi:hypothetical protein
MVDWTGRTGKNASMEKMEALSSVFQNVLVFLGRFGKATLSEFPEIFGSFVNKEIFSC